MATATEKKAMLDFIISGIETSGMYNIKSRGKSSLIITEKPEIVVRPSTILIVAHNKRIPVKDIIRVEREKRGEGVYTAHIFYKGEELYMVRLAQRAHTKAHNRSLKNYSIAQINSMIHLRDQEKIFLDSYGGPLVYYQPRTERLDESLRTYRMKEVELDYSHVTRGHRSFGFTKNKSSIDYKIAEEIGSITRAQPLIFIYNAQDFKKIARIRIPSD